MLANAPRVSILCTSRAPLGLAGEQLWPVAELAEAVDLFVERVRAHRPGYAPADGERAVIGDICRRLDGLPLVIELAAARARSIHVSDLAERLTRQFSLLAAARLASPARHATLHAVVQWSYGLLDEHEKALFDRLSVFSGAFGLTAVERVCADPQLVGAPQAASLLAALVDKSMVITVEHPAQSRYRVLETLREFGAERLAERGETRLWLDRHARWCADLVQSQQDALLSEREPTAWDVLGAEWDNLRAAFSHALDSGQVDIYAPLAAGVGMHGFASNRCEVGEWAAAAIAAGMLAGWPEEVELHGIHGWWAYWVAADLPLAETVTRQWCDRPSQDRSGLCQFANFMARAVGAADRAAADALSAAWLAALDLTPAARVLSQFVRAIYGVWFADPAVDAAALTAAACRAAARTGSPSLLAWARFMQGAACVYTNPGAAQQALQHAIELAGALSAEHHVCVLAHHWLAVAAVLSADQPTALRRARAGLTEAKTLRIRTAAAVTLRAAALALARAGRHRCAALALGAADATGHNGRSVQPLITETERLLRQAVGVETAALIDQGRWLTLTAAIDAVNTELTDLIGQEAEPAQPKP
ncbi:MAG: ATP-binding protein [Acidimicrobiales bacterium]